MEENTFTQEELEIIKEEKNRYQREYNKKNSEKRKVWNARYYLNLRKKREQGKSEQI